MPVRDLRMKLSRFPEIYRRQYYRQSATAGYPTGLWTPVPNMSVFTVKVT